MQDRDDTDGPVCWFVVSLNGKVWIETGRRTRQLFESPFNQDAVSRRSNERLSDMAVLSLETNATSAEVASD